MSSTIKLYEHNQKTYDALLDMLGERDRACIINARYAGIAGLEGSARKGTARGVPLVLER